MKNKLTYSSKEDKNMELATKKQLWTLYCLTKQDYRNKNLTKQEASQLISKIINEKKEQTEKIIKELQKIIQLFWKYSEEIKKQKDGQITIIYDTDKKNGNIWYEKNFFLCGVLYLKTTDRKLANILKRISKYQDWLKISKDYYFGYNISIKNVTGYKNGNFQIAVEALEKAVKETDLNITVYSKLD